MGSRNELLLGLVKTVTIGDLKAGPPGDNFTAAVAYCFASEILGQSIWVSPYELCALKGSALMDARHLKMWSY